MIHSPLIIDDALTNPEEYIKFAQTIPYWGPSATENWKGCRSSSLVDLNNELFNNTISQLIEKTFTFNPELVVSYDGAIAIHFHYLTKEFIADYSWIHKDISLFAGVLYLNHKKNSGTNFYDENKNLAFKVKSKYNRLVVYNGNLFHAAESGFGDSVLNSRLTLIFFVYNFSIKGRG